MPDCRGFVYAQKKQGSLPFHRVTLLDLSQGLRSARIKVTVSPNGAQISGAVLDKDGDKLPGGLAIVLLVDDPAKLDLNDAPENMARVGADGKYRFLGIRPGKYKLVGRDEPVAHLKQNSSFTFVL